MSVQKIFINTMIFWLWVAAMCYPFFVYASEPMVRITEILYDAEGRDNGKEYVEVVNIGPGEIDMTTVKFFERDDRSTGRSIKQGIGGTILQPGGVAVIVADPTLFSSNYDFDGAVLDTSGFTLLNAGSTVSLKQSGRVLHSITYSSGEGAQGDGKALHIANDDSISSGSPSIGTVRNIAIDTGTPVRVGDSSEEVTDRAANIETPDKPVLMIKPSVVFPASTTEFSVIHHDEGGNEKALYGSWNFGDGTYMYGDIVNHAYLHVGAYIVTFQEHTTQDQDEGDDTDTDAGASVQQNIEVKFPQISVERLNEAFVRLHNHHTFDLNISGWQIVSSNGSAFVFPDGSLVSADNTVTIPFLVNDQEEIFFVTAGGGQFSGKNTLAVNGNQKKEGSVSDSSAEERPSGDRAAPKEGKQGEKQTSSDDSSDTTTSDVRVVGSKNLLSSGTSRIVSEGGSIDSNSSTYTSSVSKTRMVVIWILLLTTIILIALAPLFFARRDKKKNISK